jgi:hypothetical protein
MSSLWGEWKLTLTKQGSGYRLDNFHINGELFRDLDKIRQHIRQHSIDTGNADVAKGYDFEEFLNNALYVYRADMFEKGIGKTKEVGEPLK